jgi:hypothetical protein
VEYLLVFNNVIFSVVFALIYFEVFDENQNIFHYDNVAKPLKPAEFALSAPVSMCYRVLGRGLVHNGRLIVMCIPVTPCYSNPAANLFH